MAPATALPTWRQPTPRKARANNEEANRRAQNQAQPMPRPSRLKTLKNASNSLPAPGEKPALFPGPSIFHLLTNRVELVDFDR